MTAALSLFLVLVAIWASTSSGIAAPGADHVERGPGACRAHRRPQYLPVDRDNPAAGLGESPHKLLKAKPKLIRIELAEYAAEGIVTRYSILQTEKAAKKLLLRLGKDRHIDGRLASC